MCVNPMKNVDSVENGVPLPSVAPDRSAALGTCYEMHRRRVFSVNESVSARARTGSSQLLLFTVGSTLLVPPGWFDSKGQVHRDPSHAGTFAGW